MQKEIRSSALVYTVKSRLPNAGHVKLATKDGLKVSFVFRNTPFFATSRLIVREQGLGNSRFKGVDTTDAVEFTNRLRQVA